MANPAPNRSRRATLAVVALGGLVIIGGVATAALWPDDPPPPAPTGDSDTGLDRMQIENLMRTIGYVQ